MTKKPNSRANLDRAIERPTVVKGDDWETLYNDANFKHGVSRTIDEAVVWANELIATIAKA